MTKTNIFSLGGTVQASKGIYISRQADETLLELCKQGEFSYVLTSRQMGKSSLMINTASELKKADIKSVIIDLTKIGTQVTVEQWYLGLLLEIEEQLMLDTNIVKWWQKNDNLGFTQRLTNFFQHVLLEDIKSPVVIFLDEIDTTIGFDFTDDFFAAVRYLYVARAQYHELERLSFVLIGVATPRDLICDLKRTSFNIGQLVDLTYFTFEEAKPLAEGLGLSKEKAEKLLKYVLQWTGGQPFLTQKLCKLIVTSNNEIPEDNEELWLEKLVTKRIIENWKRQDEPQHLRTIRDRVLKDERRTGRLLSIYQRILQIGGIEVDGSSEQIELRLSGLVIESQGKLRVYNRIYELVFNLDWIEKQLSILRPYAQTFKSWVASNCKEKSYLLRGQALENAKTWAIDKDLGDLDFKFLSACQELEKSQVQVELEAERQANKLLAQAERDAKKQADKLLAEAKMDAEKRIAQAKHEKRRLVITGFVFLISSLAVSSLALINASQSSEKAETALKDTRKALRKARYSEIQVAHSESKILTLTGDYQGALIARVRAATEIYKIEKEKELPKNIEKLKNEILSGLQPQNIASLENQSTVKDISVSPNGKLFASASYNKIQLRNLDENSFQTFSRHTHKIVSLSFSPDGKLLASASSNKINLWSSDGKFLRPFKVDNNKIASVNFRSDGKKLISASHDNTVRLWNLDGTLDTIFKRYISHAYEVEKQDLNFENLLNNACSKISKDLENNPNISEEDKKLCDDIPANG